MMAWYCAYTKPRCEELAVDQLKHMGFKSLLLTFIPNARKPLLIRPLFPRYLFVEFDWLQDDWRRIRSSIGVQRLLDSPDGVPIAVPDKTMDRLQVLYNSGDADPWLETRAPIDPGTKVRILSGRFAHPSIGDAICSWSDSYRLKLLFAFMGREVEVMFERDEVEPL